MPDDISEQYIQKLTARLQLIKQAEPWRLVGECTAGDILAAARRYFTHDSNDTSLGEALGLSAVEFLDMAEAVRRQVNRADAKAKEIAAQKKWGDFGKQIDSFKIFATAKLKDAHPTFSFDRLTSYVNLYTEAYKAALAGKTPTMASLSSEEALLEYRLLTGEFEVGAESVHRKNMRAKNHATALLRKHYPAASPDDIARKVLHEEFGQSVRDSFKQKEQERKQFLTFVRQAVRDDDSIPPAGRAHVIESIMYQYDAEHYPFVAHSRRASWKIAAPDKEASPYARIKKEFARLHSQDMER